MQYTAAGGEVLLRSGAVVLGGVSSIYCLGITWSCLLAFSVWAVYVVYSKIVAGEIEGRNSIESLENPLSPYAKKKRILAKKKEKYEKKRRKPADAEDEDDIDVGLKRSQELVDENMFGNIDYEAAGAYHGVFAMPVSDAGKLTRRSIPSLKSPQPLLYAFHSRVSKREQNQMSPVLPGSGYPLSPRRSVFDSLQNRSLNSPLNRSWTFKEASMFRTQGLEAHKAISPLSGRYFSRIRHDFSQENKRDLEWSPATSARKDRSLETQDKTRFGTMGEHYTKEEIVKVLQEKTASKRKRTTPKEPDLTVLVQDRYSKRRRVEKDIFDESVTELKKDESVSNHQHHMDKVEAAKGQEVPAGSGKILSNKNKQDGIQARNKYGIKENEVESITDNDDDDNDDMEVDKAQSKRKAEESFETKKGKKTREDAADRSKRKDDSQTPLSAKNTKKATPVRSIETQTPTKFGESNTPKSNARSRSSLKTPYKRVFVSGFPSNLKPGSTEKRRKVPFFSGSLGGNENIELGLEEYGPLGVTSAEYAADKQAEMERIMTLLGDNDSSEDRSAPSPESTTTSVTANTPESQALTSNKHSEALTFSTCSTTASFTKPPQTVPSQLPKFGSATLSTSTDTSADGTIKRTQQSDNLLASTSSNSNSAATSTASASQANPVISKSHDNALPLSFGLQTAQTTSAATLASTMVKSSASTVLGQTQQSSLAFGGFNFGSQSSSSTSTTSSAPSVAFGQPLNVVSKPQTSQSPALSTGSTAFSQLTQPATSGFGGFNFGSSVGSNQQLQLQANTIETESSSDVRKGAIGSSFGTNSTQQQPQARADAQLPIATSTSLPFSAVAKPGGFTFGATTSSPSQTSSSTTFGGFNFGVTTTSSSQTSSNSSFSGLNFGTATTSSSQASSSTTFGGFSFGSQLKASTSSVSASSSSAAPLGTGFKFETTKSTAPSAFSGFSFSAAPTSQEPKTGMPVVGSLKDRASVGATSQTSATTTSSIFQVLPTTSQLPFAPKVSSETANLFGAPTTSAGFGPQLQFGNAQGNSSGQLFGTPSCSQTPSLFGNLTQSKSSIGSSFGLSSQSSSAGGSLFAPPSLGGNTSGNFFSAPSQSSNSNSTMLGGASDQIVKTESIFNVASQGTQQSGLLFGAQPTSTAAPLFGMQTAASSFSFGASQNAPAFGSLPSTTSAGAGGGGFLFGSNPPSSSTSATAIAPFGQTNNNAFGQFGGQNSSGSNPFASSSVFGQAPSAAPATTSSGFSFGSTTATFGQTSSNQSSFGASLATFQPITDQPQAGGFNFASAAAQKSASFSFGGTSSGGGFASRPGTPTPFNNPPAPATDLFASPQPQNAGFALGSGAPGRPTMKGRRRTRR